MRSDASLAADARSCWLVPEACLAPAAGPGACLRPGRDPGEADRPWSPTGDTRCLRTPWQRWSEIRAVVGAQHPHRGAPGPAAAPPQPGGLRIAYLVYRGNPRCGGPGCLHPPPGPRAGRAGPLGGGLRRASPGPSSTTAWASPRCRVSTSTATPTRSGCRTPASSVRRTTCSSSPSCARPGSPSPAPSRCGPGGCWRPAATTSTSSTTTSAWARACSACSRTGGRCSPPCTTPSPSTGSWRCRTPRTPTAA